VSGSEQHSLRSSDGVTIAYRHWPAGDGSPPVLLQHGFTADSQANWVQPGVVAALLEAGRGVLAPDARGHGRSEKPHDPARYGEPRMARDLAELLDALGLDSVDLVGYSMGAVVALLLASGDRRVRRLAVGGVGSGVVECGGVDRRAISTDSIIAALSAADGASVAGTPAAAFRRLADAIGADRTALVAQASAVYQGGVELSRISAPTLVLAGDADPLADRPGVLCEAIADARLTLVAGDHMQAVADPRFAQALVAFLG